MPRPKGWKPLSYTVIAQICGQIVLGKRRAEIARTFGVQPHTVQHFKQTLVQMGAAAYHETEPKLSLETDAAIHDLIRSTRLTNFQIYKRLSLSCTEPVRRRRKTYHDELRLCGKPVPLCGCGDEFQHAHRCRFMLRGPKPVKESDSDDVIAELVAGDRLEEVQRRYRLGQIVAAGLLKQLSRSQKNIRRRNIAARRAATKRRNELAPEAVLGRIQAGVPATLPSEVRNEVIQVMAVDVLEGLLTIDDALGRVRSYTSKAYRSLGDWRNVSIDAERDGLSLGDLIEDESAMEAFAEMDEMELA